MLEKILLMRKIMNDPYLQGAVRTNLTSALNKTLYNYALQQRNIIMSFYGKQGTGKSFASFYYALLWSSYTGKSFTIDNVAFTNIELLEKLKYAKDGEIYVKDEQLDTFGEGSERSDASILNVEAVIRMSQISLFYNSPEPRLHMHHYTLLCTGLSAVNNLNTRVHILFDGMDKKPMGYVISKMPQIDKKFLDEYNKKKMQFIKGALKQEIEDITKEWSKVAAEYYKKYLKKRMQENRLFGSKKELLLDIQKHYKINFTEKEWKNIRIFVEHTCRENNEIPYNPRIVPNW